MTEKVREREERERGVKRERERAREGSQCPSFLLNIIIVKATTIGSLNEGMQYTNYNNTDLQYSILYLI